MVWQSVAAFAPKRSAAVKAHFRRALRGFRETRSAADRWLVDFVTKCPRAPLLTLPEGLGKLSSLRIHSGDIASCQPNGPESISQGNRQ